LTIRCLLVDDEHLALALLEKYVSDTPGLATVEKCRSAVRAIEILQTEIVDLLFLDIQMPVLNGMGLLKSISRKPATIFTTAYPRYAAEAFDANAIDYLLKPYSYERFVQAIGKAKAILEAGQQETSLSGHLTVKSDRKWIKITLQDIRYIEGWKEYVKIFTRHEKIITLEGMNNLETMLPAEHFLRVHKSYIVAQSAILRMEGSELVLTGNVKIPVARARKKEVTEILFK